MSNRTHKGAANRRAYAVRRLREAETPEERLSLAFDAARRELAALAVRDARKAEGERRRLADMILMFADGLDVCGCRECRAQGILASEADRTPGAA